MTVCIASLCSNENGNPQNVVVASDRMVTLGNFMEFEHEVSKITKLTSKSVVLVAGDTLRGSKIVDTVKSKLHELQDLKIPEIATLVAKWYSESRNESIENDIFKLRGFTRQDFYDSYQTKLLPQLAYQLDAQVMEYNYGVQLIVAGVDDDGAHAYFIDNPGTNCTDIHQIGYTAIGSGAIHATQALIGFGHSASKELKLTVFTTFAAKRRGEVAPGVGKDTDLFIVTADGIQELTQEEIKMLNEIYENEYHKPLADNVKSKVDAIEFIKQHNEK